VLGIFGLTEGRIIGKETTTSTKKFIDLTYSFNADTVTWPGRKSTFNVEKEGITPGGYWYFQNSLYY